MRYAIIGFGAVGQALAKAFARKGLEVTVATRRPPEQLEDKAKALGPTVKPASLRDAVAADVVILAFPYGQHEEVGKAATSWNGKLVIDATNAFGTPLAQFNGLTAAGVAAKNYPGARFVKGLNHLAAAVLAADPAVHGGRRVIFVSSDDPASLEPANALIEQLGYAPVSLGTLAESGPLTSARGDSWSPLDFKDFVKFGDE